MKVDESNFGMSNEDLLRAIELARNIAWNTTGKLKSRAEWQYEQLLEIQLKRARIFTAKEMMGSVGEIEP